MRRVILGFVLMAVLAVLLGAGALLLLSGALEREERLVSHHVAALVETEQLSRASSVAGRKVSAYLLTGDPRLLEQVRLARGEVQRLTGALGARTDAEGRALLAQVAAAQARVDAAADRALAASPAGEASEEARRLFETQLQPAREALDTALAALVRSERSRFERSREAAARSASRALSVLLLGLLGTVAAAVVLGVLQVRALAERQRTDAERLSLGRERSETLALLDALLDAAPVGVAFLDRGLRFVRVNQVLAELNGSPVAAHLGRRPSEVVDGQGEAQERLLHRVLDTGLPLLDLELAANGSGSVRHLLLNYFPVHTTAGEVLGVGVVVVDITDRKRAEQELLRTADFRERLLGIVSHDLRNPLNAITLSSRTLLQGGTLPERERRHVQRIHSSSHRMGVMIAELLDFTRSRLGGGIPVHPAPGDLFPLCREAAEEAAVAARAEGRVQVELRGSGHGHWDTSRMAQVVGNLVGNALRYSPPGSPVRLVVDGEGEVLVLAVHNAGEPIEESLLPGLFDPFRRGAAHAREHGREGLGLGLYIVEQVVRAHGGSICVTSTHGDGTTFTVRLPRGEQRPEAPPALPA